MLIHIPDHFSSKLLFDFSKLPANVVDRFSVRFATLGIIFGIFLLILGIFEIFSFATAETNSGQSFLTVEIFAFLIILLALGMIIGSIFSFIRCKRFYFDGKEFQITYRPTVGLEHTLTEPLKNYMGVRLRVLFAQNGLFNKSRYIIDLYHRDPNKIIPLFITTKNKNIRKIWERYAKLFGLPALSVGDRGLIQREPEDLDKSLKELFLANKLPYIASGKLPAPESLTIEEEKDATCVEPTGIYWDTFSTLFLLIAIAAVFILIAGAVFLTIVGTSIPLRYWAAAGILLIAVLYFATKLFNSYKLIIKKDKVIVHETLFGSLLCEESLETNKVENVELCYNPTIDRYSLSVISDDKAITFGSRLPVNDLVWLRDFVIRKLIGN